MGGERNLVHLVRATGVETLPEGPKDEVARALAARIAGLLNG
jgi:phosphopantothenoylcysteine decarboxylase/phosphopantothenate--cysteine ligase